MSPKRPPHPWLKPAIWTGCLAPLALMPIRALTHGLGANPISEALNELGLLALVMLFASLACTPAKVLFGWTWPIRVRRALGLIAFIYVCAHFLTYAVLDQGINFGAIVSDIVKRKFIFVGFAALVMLVPLAWTSRDASVRQLGFNRWKALHRLAYVAGVLGAIHFIWRVKKDITQPAIYAAILGALLLIRIVDAMRASARRAKPRLAS